MREFTCEDAKRCRSFFPALSRQENNQTAIFFDGPAGTQVPVTVVDAMSEYLLGCNANHGGLFTTSQQSDRWLEQTHQACAEFVGATDPNEIAFGQNMTSLTFAFSRALSKTWTAGENIIVTRLDHDANVSPWVMAAHDANVEVRWLSFNHEDYTLEFDKLESLIDEKTRLVAVGCASNATGGINPVTKIAELAHSYQAEVFLDAVHFAPHDLIDVRTWNCDYLVCSAYKFFGPHLGIFWGKRNLLQKIEAYRVRPAGDQLPGKWMTGTQSHESMAGTLACIDYLTEIGRQLSGQQDSSRRENLAAAFEGIRAYEQMLSRKLIEGLHDIAGIKIYGITDIPRLDERFPTFSNRHENVSSTDNIGWLVRK